MRILLRDYVTGRPSFRILAGRFSYLPRVSRKFWQFGTSRGGSLGHGYTIATLFLGPVRITRCARPRGL